VTKTRNFPLHFALRPHDGCTCPGYPSRFIRPATDSRTPHSGAGKCFVPSQRFFVGGGRLPQPERLAVAKREGPGELGALFCADINFLEGRAASVVAQGRPDQYGSPPRSPPISPPKFHHRGGAQSYCVALTRVRRTSRTDSTPYGHRTTHRPTHG
jgi:hypothetical protein